MGILRKQAQARIGDIRKWLPVLERNHLKVPTKFAKRRPVRRDTISLLNVEAQLAHEIDAFLPDVGMLGGHREVTLDIRENAVSTNGLNMDVRLRGAGLSALMLANEYGLNGRIGHRASHHLSGDPEHVIAVPGR